MEIHFKGSCRPERLAMIVVCAGGRHAFLVDHNIDGRVLMPATSYVCTAWEAAAVAAGKDMKSFPVEFRDVQIHQAVVVTGGQKITLGVQITPDHHFFVSLPAAPAKRFESLDMH